MGGSGEKRPSQDMEKIFSNFQICTRKSNPLGLEIAVCSFFAKTVLDIFAVCLLTTEG